ncbi:MAG: glycosyltransferase [Coriobacteriaceae bacterium]|nr:glycosyltransferase [Coriobacteriaceae bacterium]
MLSVTLLQEEPRFTVMHRGAALARMTPRRHAMLRNRQNLLMVNPGIDGAFHAYLPTHDAMLQTKAEGMDSFQVNPRISIIVPLFNTPIAYARDMIRSVLEQRYENWELVLVNASPDNEALARVISEHPDERIRVIEQVENLGIAGNTNIGIRACTGDYIAFLDHDDMLDPLALHMYVQALNEQPEIDLFYCDEDNFRETLADRYSPIFKPDFNIDLLYSHNYVEHFLMVSRTALEQVELSPHDVRGAQDYDLTLKVAEIARAIHHEPYLLYHWRAHPGSTNGGNMEGKPYAIEASIRALDRHFERTGVAARAHETDIPCVFSIAYEPLETPVYVALRYRTLEGLQARVAELERQTHHTLLHVAAFGPDTDQATHIIEESELAACTAASENGILSARIASLFDRACTEQAMMMLCTDYVSFTDANCIGRLSGCFRRPDVAIAAPKLLSSDGLVQHAGCYLELDNGLHATMPNQGFAPHMGGGYLGIAECSCDYGSVGPNCLMLTPARIEDAHEDLPSFESLEALVHHLACAARANGRHVMVLPEATATVCSPIVWDWSDARAHHVPDADRELLERRWAGKLTHDPLANPHAAWGNGYPNLAVERDINREARRIYLYNLVKGKR